MRYYCWFCQKSVTTELPSDSVIRAILVCPECISERKITIPEKTCDCEIYQTCDICRSK